MNDAADFSGCLSSTAGSVRISVLVQPRASRTAIGSIHNDRLKIFVSAPPVDSAANEALIKLLAKILGCPKSAIRILCGAESRRKTIDIMGVTAVYCMARLEKGPKGH